MRKMLTIIIVIISVLIFSLSIYAKKEEAVTGYMPPSSEEKDWMNKNMINTKQINLNKVGIDRVKKNKNSSGKTITVAQVPVGYEVIENDTNKKLDGSVSTSTQVISTEKVTDNLGANEVPDSVDNSTLPYFPPVSSQGKLSSCACFSTTYYTATHMTGLARNINTQSKTDMTNKFSPKWVYNMINGGKDDGSTLQSAYKVMLVNGLVSWSSFPYDTNYTEWDTKGADWQNALNFRMDKTGVIRNLDTETGLLNTKKLLVNGYILNYATYISSWQFVKVGNDPQTSEDDIFVGQNACSYVNGNSGAHAMTIVGYNDNIWIDINQNSKIDANEKGAFKVVNSYGTSWKNSGFAWISYDAINSTSKVQGAPTSRNEAFFDKSVYWITAKPSYIPKLMAKVKLNHSKRSELAVTLGFSDTSANVPSKIWSSFAVNQKGGDLSFNGTNTSIDAEFVFDFTELIDYNNLNSVKKRWYIGLKDAFLNGNSLSIKQFVLINSSGKEVYNSGNIDQKIDGATKYLYCDYQLGDESATNSQIIIPTTTTITNTSSPKNTPTNNVINTPNSNSDDTDNDSKLNIIDNKSENTVVSSAKNTSLEPTPTISTEINITTETTKITPRPTLNYSPRKIINPSPTKTITPVIDNTDDDNNIFKIFKNIKGFFSDIFGGLF